MLTNEEARRKIDNERIVKEMVYLGYRKVDCPRCHGGLIKADDVSLKELCLCCAAEGFLWRHKDE